MVHITSVLVQTRLHSCVQLYPSPLHPSILFPQKVVYFQPSFSELLGPGFADGAKRADADSFAVGGHLSPQQLASSVIHLHQRSTAQRLAIPCQ